MFIVDVSSFSPPFLFLFVFAFCRHWWRKQIMRISLMPCHTWKWQKSRIWSHTCLFGKTKFILKGFRRPHKEIENVETCNIMKVVRFMFSLDYTWLGAFLSCLCNGGAIMIESLWISLMELAVLTWIVVSQLFYVDRIWGETHMFTRTELAVLTWVVVSQLFSFDQIWGKTRAFTITNRHTRNIFQVLRQEVLEM